MKSVKKIIEFEDLAKKLIEVAVKEEDFSGSLPYVFEIKGYLYGGYLPDKNSKKKVAFFDLDGSLEKVSTPSVATLTILSLEEKCKISSKEIFKIIAEMLRTKDVETAEERLTKILKNSSFNFNRYEEIGYEVANKFTPVRNSKELVKSLSEKMGYASYLTSLSFELPVKLIGKKLGFDFSYGSKLSFDKDGKFLSFHFLRKEKIRDEIFKQSSIPHGCYCVIDDDPNFAPVLKFGINPYFLVKEIEGFDNFIHIPEAREKDDMLLIKKYIERWDSVYIELCINSVEEELEKIKIAKQIKKAYSNFSPDFPRLVWEYMKKEKRMERKARLLDLLVDFKLSQSWDIAEEINKLLSYYPAYKMSEKFEEIIKAYK